MWLEGYGEAPGQVVPVSASFPFRQAPTPLNDWYQSVTPPCDLIIRFKSFWGEGRLGWCRVGQAWGRKKTCWPLGSWNLGLALLCADSQHDLRWGSAPVCFTDRDVA